jgi:hypothetical protein
MKHLLVSVYKVCSNKSPWVKLALQRWGGGVGLWGGLYTGERSQGHHGPLVSFYVKIFKSRKQRNMGSMVLFPSSFLFPKKCFQDKSS